MNNQFDELTKGMAQSVTRRAALKKFGLGLAGMALACFGLANKAQAMTKCDRCVKKCLQNCPTCSISDCGNHCFLIGACTGP